MRGKCLALMLLFACCLYAAAATDGSDAVLDRIESANASVKGLECRFSHERAITSAGRSVTKEGMLYYEAPDRLALHYSAPSTDLLIVDRTRLFTRRGPGQGSLYDTTRNRMVASLRNTLMDCVQGKVRKVAGDNDASLSVSRSGGNYIIRITPKENQVNGYTRIVLCYRESDCVLVRLQMDEVSGVSNVYTMSGISSAAPDPSVFDIPKKS